MYLQSLQNNLFELSKNINLGSMLFQHEVVLLRIELPHRILRDYLHQRYPELWIGYNAFMSWPPNSPDLISCDFFLKEYVKGIVFVTEPPQLRSI